MSDLFFIRWKFIRHRSRVFFANLAHKLKCNKISHMLERFNAAAANAQNKDGCMFGFGISC